MASKTIPQQAIDLPLPGDMCQMLTGYAFREIWTSGPAIVARVDQTKFITVIATTNVFDDIWYLIITENSKLYWTKRGHIHKLAMT